MLTKRREAVVNKHYPLEISSLERGIDALLVSAFPNHKNIFTSLLV